MIYLVEPLLTHSNSASEERSSFTAASANQRIQNNSNNANKSVNDSSIHPVLPVPATNHGETGNTDMETPKNPTTTVTTTCDIVPMKQLFQLSVLDAAKKETAIVSAD